MNLSELLQAPVDTPLSSAAFRGKSVVLEFWATWCGGCVAAIPHLNELVKQFQDGPVIFLSVTDEDPVVVRSFLRRRPMRGWVGIDANGVTFKQYGIVGRPQTILIDAHGIVRALTDPNQVTPGLIGRLISGEAIRVNPESSTAVVIGAGEVPGAPSPLLEVLVRPAAIPSVSGFSPGAQWHSGGQFNYYGATLRMLLEYANDIRGDRIIAPAWFDQNRYDLFTAVPQGRQNMRKSLSRQTLWETFQLVTRRETRPTEVYVLRVAPEGAVRMKVSDAKLSPGFLPQPGHFTGVATGIPQLIAKIGVDLGSTEIVDETNLTGRYNFDLKWDKGNRQSLQDALRSQLGLSLTKRIVPEEFLVIASANGPKTW